MVWFRNGVTECKKYHQFVPNGPTDEVPSSFLTSKGGGIGAEGFVTPSFEIGAEFVELSCDLTAAPAADIIGLDVARVTEVGVALFEVTAEPFLLR